MRRSFGHKKKKHAQRWVFTSEERALVVLTAATSQLQLLEQMGANLSGLDENGRLLRAILKIAQRAREEILAEQEQQNDDANDDSTAPSTA